MLGGLCEAIVVDDMAGDVAGGMDDMAQDTID